MKRSNYCNKFLIYFFFLSNRYNQISNKTKQQIQASKSKLIDFNDKKQLNNDIATSSLHLLISKQEKKNTIFCSLMLDKTEAMLFICIYLHRAS